MSPNEGTKWLERLRHRHTTLPRARADLPAWENLRSEIFDHLHAARQAYWAQATDQTHALCRALVDLLQVVDADITYLHLER